MANGFDQIPVAGRLAIISQAEANLRHAGFSEAEIEERLGPISFSDEAADCQWITMSGAHICIGSDGIIKKGPPALTHDKDGKPQHYKDALPAAHHGKAARAAQSQADVEKSKSQTMLQRIKGLPARGVRIALRAAGRIKDGYKQQGLLGAAKETAGVAVDLMKHKYHMLETRYGRTAAISIMAGYVGMNIVGVVMPHVYLNPVTAPAFIEPFCTLMATAEGIRQAARVGGLAVKGIKHIAGFAADDMDMSVGELVAAVRDYAHDMLTGVKAPHMPDLTDASIIKGLKAVGIIPKSPDDASFSLDESDAAAVVFSTADADAADIDFDVSFMSGIADYIDNRAVLMRLTPLGRAVSGG